MAGRSATTELDDDIDYHDPELTGLQDRLARLREEKGVVRLQFGAAPGWALLRHADVANALKDEVHFSKSLVFRPETFPWMGPNIQGYDGREHTLKRALVSPAFRRTAIPRYIESLLRPSAESVVAEFAALGEADLMRVFAKKYPLRITTRLLGIPTDDEEKMGNWAVAMLNRSHDLEGSDRACAEFAEYVTPLIEERRAHPTDDLLSGLVSEEVEGERLDDEEVLGFLRLLFPAGVDTTWLTLGSLMCAVLSHPEVHDRLLDDESEREWAVEETLRWESAVGSEPRETRQDVVVSGVEIPSGARVRLMIPVANRDPSVFDEPDRWDLDRRPTDHIAFGLGRHFCLGAFLARRELTVALDVLLHRLPNLRLLEEPKITGVILRGPRSLRVAWDAA